MPRRIEEDHKDFLDVYSGRIRKELKKYFKTGGFVKLRGKDGKIRIPVPKIDIPHFLFGNTGDGIGRGQGKPGDVIGKDPDDNGTGAGQEKGEGIEIAIDMEEVLKFLQDELQLPNLKPKPNQTYDEIKIKYNDIALQGPESLRHNRRTLIQAIKRNAAMGDANDLTIVPGFSQPMRIIKLINRDKRYRQYREIKVPSSNAVIFFARDGSASMGQAKCDIVSDMAWWIDIWIRRFYKRVERMYVWHDTQAEEVDEDKFYKYRFGGGTTCSSALKLIAQQFKNRFPPEKWNIYVIYFSDGENWNDDNKIFIDTIKNSFPPEVVNFFGLAQILAWNHQGSLKEYVDNNLKVENVRTTSIGPEKAPSLSNASSFGFYGTPQLSEEETNEQIKRAIIDLLGNDNPDKVAKEMVDGGVLLSA